MLRGPSLRERLDRATLEKLYVDAGLRQSSSRRPRGRWSLSGNVRFPPIPAISDQWSPSTQSGHYFLFERRAGMIRVHLTILPPGAGIEDDRGDDWGEWNFISL